MKNQNKKGFTIVELVIVIAVIAILAAVLIPTFAGLVAKANLSADKSFVKNANTTLAVEGAGENFATAGDAIDALNRNGYSGKYNTYSSNYHYLYSLENNKMYLIDDKGAVVYPEEDIDVATLWGLYTDNRTSVTAGVTKYVAMVNITNADHYNDVFATGTYTIDLNGFYISVEATDEVKANVKVSNGVMINGATADENVNTDYELVENAMAGGDNEKFMALGEYDETNNTLTIKNKIFTKFVQPYLTDKNIVFENCIFYGEARLQFGDSGGADEGMYAEVKNCQFIDIDADGGAWAIISFRSLKVTDCTFTNLISRGAIQIHEDSKDMTVEISGCTFNGTGGTYPMIRFVGRSKPEKEECKLASFTLSNCNFTTLNKAKGVIGFSGTASSLYNYDGSGVTVTFTSNKVAENITADKYLVDAGAGNTLGELFAASLPTK